MIKDVLRSLIPPLFIDIKRQLFNNQPKQSFMWTGDYNDWAEVQKVCAGYDDNEILNKCKSALLKVKSGEAVYERDSVLFGQKQYSWPLLAALQNAALSDNKLCVLDFGGSLGSTYYQNKSFLDSVHNLQWCVVEQTHFAQCGQQNFQDDRLKFYESIDACLAEHTPNVILLSSVLQYLETPYTWLQKIIDLKVDHLIIDRTSFISGAEQRLTLQTVPSDIYKGSYGCWFFTETRLKKHFEDKYDINIEFKSFADPDGYTEDNKLLYWKGFYLKRKK